MQSGLSGRFHLLQSDILHGLPPPVIGQSGQGAVTLAQLETGVHVDIPDGPNLCDQDIIQLWWGSNALLSQVDKHGPEPGPGTPMFINGRQLRRIETGWLRVSYHVRRQDRLFAVSTVITVHVRPLPPALPRPSRWTQPAHAFTERLPE